MRILHVYHGGLFGGIETFLVTLAKWQNLCPDMQHNFALCFEGRLSRELRKETNNVFILGKVRISRPWTVWRGRKNLVRLIKKEKFDLAICHGSWPQVIFGPVFKSASIPLVYYLHAPIQKKMHWLDRLTAFTVPDLMIAVSKHMLQTASKMYPRVKTEVLYYPLPWEAPEIKNIDKQNFRTKFGIDSEATVIIQVSRMERWKGQDLHLKALTYLSDLQNWSCWFIGGAQRRKEKRYFDYLEYLIEKLGLRQRVVLFGEQADVLPFLKSADIFCQVNREPESFGIAFMEAFSLGLPIVTVNIGGAPELIDSSCGILVDTNEPKEIALALRKLITDKKLRTAMGEAGQKKVDMICNTEKQINKLYNLLAQIIKKE